MSRILNWGNYLKNNRHTGLRARVLIVCVTAMINLRLLACTAAWDRGLFLEGPETFSQT